MEAPGNQQSLPIQQSLPQDKNMEAEVVVALACVVLSAAPNGRLARGPRCRTALPLRLAVRLVGCTSCLFLFSVEAVCLGLTRMKLRSTCF